MIFYGFRNYEIRNTKNEVVRKSEIVPVTVMPFITGKLVFLVI
jgi:hypothetical protein